MTPREARAVAKKMFAELAKTSPRLSMPRGPRLEDRVVDNPEFLERAAVLADVVLQSDRSDVGEALALAVAGRVTPYSQRFYQLGVGKLLPPGTETTELVDAVGQARSVLFPQRRSPRMPNRADLRRLVVDAHGEGREAREWLRTLWREMEVGCGGGRPAGRTLDTANSAIRGYGVELTAYRTHDGDDVVGFDFVNTGDIYNETVGFIYEAGRPRSRRFLITTEGDVRADVERRMRNRGEWSRW